MGLTVGFAVDASVVGSIDGLPVGASVEGSFVGLDVGASVVGFLSLDTKERKWGHR